MRPDNLTEGSFDRYPPLARSLALRHLRRLRTLPPVLTPLLLDQIIAFDNQFPVEQDLLERELDYLDSLSSAALEHLMSGFARIQVAGSLESLNWTEHPEVFSEQLSASLWSTGQMDAFRAAAENYAAQIRQAVPEKPPVVPRICIVAVGQGVSASPIPLFRKLRPYGTYFSNIDPNGGLAAILQFLQQRNLSRPIPYGHWYIDGGPTLPHLSAGISCISWAALASARHQLTKKMEAVVQSGSGGPELLSAMMSQLKPKDLGIASTPATSALNAFQVDVLTKGSGTQIFSTSFVQWSAREVLRRAQPLTMVARFAPRQRFRPMNELIAGSNEGGDLDPDGSLIDADMASWYTWINLKRLSASDRSVFVVWFEDHNEALVVSPNLPAGTESSTSFSMERLLDLAAERA